MRKKILGILTAVSVMVLYLITGTAIVNAADTSQIGNSMDCTFYVHCETNIDKIAFNKTSISKIASEDPVNNTLELTYYRKVPTKVVPSNPKKINPVKPIAKTKVIKNNSTPDTGDPLYWQTWTIIMIICCGFMIFSHHKFK